MYGIIVFLFLSLVLIATLNKIATKTKYKRWAIRFTIGAFALLTVAIYGSIWTTTYFDTYVDSILYLGKSYEYLMIVKVFSLFVSIVIGIIFVKKCNIDI